MSGGLAAADPWAAFRAPPPGAAPPADAPAVPVASSVPAAASADPWAAFRAPPASAPAPASSGGQGGGFDLTGLGLRPAAPVAAPGAAAAPAPAAAAGTSSAAPSTSDDASLGHRFGVGVRDVLEGTIGLPYDLAAKGLRTIGLPVNDFDTNLTALGLPDATTARQQLVSSAVQGAASALAPAGVVNSLARAGMMAAPVAASVTGALGDFSAGNAALGASAGVASNVAASAVPDAYKPLAGTLGGLVGIGLPVAGVAGVRAAGGALADIGGRAGIGPRTVLQDATGQALTGADGKPVAFTPAQARAAGSQIQAAASDPAAVASVLANPPAQLVPGSLPTTAQVTGDAGLGQLERAASTRLPEGFIARAADQNAARVGAVANLAPAGASADALPAAMQSRAALLDRANDAEVTGAQARAQAALNAIGGDQGAGAEGDLGAALRAPIAAASQASKRAVTGFYDAIDPAGTLAVDMRPIQARAASIMGEMSPNAAPLVGEEAGIMQTAQGLPDVQSFQDMGALRTRITNAIRIARGPQGDPETVRRLSQLLGGVDDAQAAAVNSADLPAAPGAAAPGPVPPPAPAPAAAVAAPNVGTDVFAPSGQRVGVRYELADAGDLVTSHNDDMSVNPAFPPELQPRARDRAASEVQVANIASRLQPERLGASSTVADGAPIVGPDGIVESGNGRVMALRRAYQADGRQAAAYRDWLAGQGHDVAGMDQPVLIRRRTTPLSPAERVAFTGEGSTPTTLAMSATERAAGDARRLTPDVLDNLQPGDVADPANRDFVRSFVRNVVEPGQEGSFVTGGGELSREGAQRVRNALVVHAYGDAGLSSALAETIDPQAKVLAGALQDAAGPMARLRAGINRGEVDPSVDLAPHLVEAVRAVQGARARGLSLADAMAQQDAFSRISPAANEILRAAYGENLTGRMSQARMADLLADYAHAAGQQSTSGSLFGSNLTRDQIFGGAAARYAKDATTGQAYDAGNAGRVGSSAGTSRNQASGSGTGASGQAASGRGDGGSARVLPAASPRLTPNFDQAAADRYAAARQAHRTHAATFKDPPGVGQALQGGPRSGEFRAADSAVPGMIFKPGADGADRVQAYLGAGGSRAALSDAAAWSLRKAAVKDGVLDPAAYGRWARAHASALSALPDVEARFLNASRAQEAVGHAVAQRAAQSRAFEKSVAGQFLGDADPAARVGKILRSDTAQADMRKLAALTQNDPVARAGIQRAVVDHVLDTMRGNAPAGNTGAAQLKSDQLQTFFRRAAPALGEVFPKAQVASMQRIAEDLQRSNLSVSGSKLPGRSNTAQDLAGSERFGGFGASLLGSFKAHGLELAGAMAGAAIHGSLGAGLGTVTARVANGMREAGIATTNDLVAHAMLDPDLARTLMTRVTPQNQHALLTTLAGRLRRASLIGAGLGMSRQRSAQGST